MKTGIVIISILLGTSIVAQADGLAKGCSKSTYDLAVQLSKGADEMVSKEMMGLEGGQMAKVNLYEMTYCSGYDTLANTCAKIIPLQRSVVEAEIKDFHFGRTSQSAVITQISKLASYEESCH